MIPSRSRWGLVILPYCTDLNGVKEVAVSQDSKGPETVKQGVKESCVEFEVKISKFILPASWFGLDSVQVKFTPTHLASFAAVLEAVVPQGTYECGSGRWKKLSNVILLRSPLVKGWTKIHIGLILSFKPRDWSLPTGVAITSTGLGWFGGTDPSSNYLSFELRGDGAVPSVSLQASFVMASVEDIFEEGLEWLLF